MRTMAVERRLADKGRCLPIRLILPVIVYMSCAAASFKSHAAAWEIPPGYPTDYAEIVSAAKREGQLVVLSNTDAVSAMPLIKAFEAAYPGIKVSYSDQNTFELDKKFRAEAKNVVATDVIWSAAMDMQIALVQDGLAAQYRSPEARNIPSWAEWGGAAYGVTYEPVVLAYNTKLLKSDEVPMTHAELERLLRINPERFRGKVVSYDIEKSAGGFLLATQDALAGSMTALLKSFGQVELRPITHGKEMLDQVEYFPIQV